MSNALQTLILVDSADSEPFQPDQPLDDIFVDYDCAEDCKVWAGACDDEGRTTAFIAKFLQLPSVRTLR